MDQSLPTPQPTVTLKLTKGKVAIIDEADLEKLGPGKWTYGKRGYVVKGGGRAKTITLHRTIMNPKKGEYIDHINGDPLDNRRCNLRIATNQQNTSNRRMSSLNTSGFKGVSWYKAGQKWHARIMVSYKNVHLGYFPKDQKEEAAHAYDKAAIEHFGDFARTNFPRSDYE